MLFFIKYQIKLTKFQDSWTYVLVHWQYYELLYTMSKSPEPILTSKDAGILELLAIAPPAKSIDEMVDTMDIKDSLTS